MRDGALNCAFMVKSISCRVISASNHTNVLFKTPYAVSFYIGFRNKTENLRLF